MENSPAIQCIRALRVVSQQVLAKKTALIMCKQSIGLLMESGTLRMTRNWHRMTFLQRLLKVLILLIQGIVLWGIIVYLRLERNRIARLSRTSSSLTKVLAGCQKGGWRLLRMRMDKSLALNAAKVREGILIGLWLRRRIKSKERAWTHYRWLKATKQHFPRSKNRLESRSSNFDKKCAEAILSLKTES